jgi:hypothetical protein
MITNTHKRASVKQRRTVKHRPKALGGGLKSSGGGAASYVVAIPSYNRVQKLAEKTFKLNFGSKMVNGNAEAIVNPG